MMLDFIIDTIKYFICMIFVLVGACIWDGFFAWLLFSVGSGYGLLSCLCYRRYLSDRDYTNEAVKAMYDSPPTLG